MDNKQMEMAFMQEGGLKDDGMNKDPVSGNEVPNGSMAKEVRDDIPAQLSEGEYVVPADVVRFYGVKHFEDLNDSTRYRSIPTSIYYPNNDGCYPLIIASHGGGGNRNGLISHIEEFVSNDYVVIAPEHVRSNTSFVVNIMEENGLSFLDALKIIAGDPYVRENRPKDISFLIDMATIWNNSDVELAGKIDLNKIGCMGHSYGAYTTSAIMGAIVNMSYGLTDYSDDRVDAGLSISPQGTLKQRLPKQDTL